MNIKKRFTLLFTIICVVSGFIFLCFNSLHNPNYICNIEVPRETRQLVYRTNKFTSLFEEEYKCIFLVNNDTMLFDVHLDSVQINSLEMVKNKYKDGSLYEMRIPLCGFFAYLNYDNSLVGQYEVISDEIDIPNSLYSLFLIPISKSEHFSYKDSKLVGWDNIFRWYYQKYFKRYLRLSNEIPTKAVIESSKGDCFQYSYKKIPNLYLVYRTFGFSPLVGHIIQYPIILLSNKQFESEIIVEDEASILYKLYGDIIEHKSCSLIKYHNGYLFCIKEENNTIPQESTLDSLISLSNRLIKSYLNINFTSSEQENNLVYYRIDE